MNPNLFNSIKVKSPQRNSFDLSHDVKLSMNMGDLVPIMCEEVVPGDTFKLTTDLLMRFAPLVSPVMHRMNVYTHFFFVPHRLVFDGWQDFITGGEYRAVKKDPNTPKPKPCIRFIDLMQHSLFTHFKDGSLADYLGFPSWHISSDSSDTSAVPNEIYTSNLPIDLMPFKSYQLIYNEYYRDQSLTDPVEIHPEYHGLLPLVSTSPSYQARKDYLKELFMLRKRAWQKDYFTSALPWPQAGESVRIPLYGDADVITNDGTDVFISNITSSLAFSPNGSMSSGNIQVAGDSINPNDPDHNLQHITYPANEAHALVDRNGSPISLFGTGSFNPAGLSVDLTKVSAATINELRRAFAAQKWLELSARGGQRYFEQLRTFFGVKSSDARLQRPEYLGGGKSPVVISDVQQTSQTTDDSPQGNLAGQAVSVQRSHSFKRFFEEHGYVIGIMSVIPESAYQQGLPRKYQRLDKEDYYWPQFANLGEQDIKNSEIFMQRTVNSSDIDEYNNGTFGYTPRYAEYKFIPSRVHGDFKNTLKFWHMGRIFKNKPVLNTDFIECKTDDRIFASDNPQDQKLLVNIHHNLHAVRPMPFYGTPL